MLRKIKQLARACESPEEFLIKLKERQHDLWMRYAEQSFPLKIVQELRQISFLMPINVLSKPEYGDEVSEFGGEYRKYWEADGQLPHVKGEVSVAGLL